MGSQNKGWIMFENYSARLTTTWINAIEKHRQTAHTYIFARYEPQPSEFVTSTFNSKLRHEKVEMFQTVRKSDILGSYLRKTYTHIM